MTLYAFPRFLFDGLFISPLDAHQRHEVNGRVMRRTQLNIPIPLLFIPLILVRSHLSVRCEDTQIRTITCTFAASHCRRASMLDHNSLWTSWSVRKIERVNKYESYNWFASSQQRRSFTHSRFHRRRRRSFHFYSLAFLDNRIIA